MENERTTRIKRKLSRELGPIVAEALDDPDVIEILLNPDGRLWVERFGVAMAERGEMTPSAAEALMDTIATALDTTITRENPILEGELPLDGSRFEGMISPVVSRPIFSIRKKAVRILSLTDYIEQSIMTPAQRDVIAAAVAARRNILVVGGTGSGKTTLTNAIIDQMVRAAPEHRLVIIEDTQEIQCAAKNSVILRTSDCVDMQRLLRSTMRLRPDRIIVGEVRGGEALTLLKSWNTGHPGGVCTLHANSALAGLIRLEQLIGEITTTTMHTLIAEAVDLVIHIEKCSEGRRIKEIIAVQRWDKTTEQYQYEPV